MRDPLKEKCKELLNDEITYVGLFDLSATPLPCTEGIRAKCECNTCGSYGRNWMCPPAVGTVDDCNRMISRYSRFLLFRSEYHVVDWDDADDLTECLRMHQENVRRIRTEIRKMLGCDVLPLSGGPCRYCENCSYPKPCKHPDKSIPSIESYGIDLMTFLESKNIRHDVNEGTVSYFGMILFN